MGLLDKLVDKIIDSAKKKKTDAVVSKLKKSNPEFAIIRFDFSLSIVTEVPITGIPAFIFSLVLFIESYYPPSNSLDST